MKTITIGRAAGSNIFIDDPRISRRHAILKISTLGKMEIVDMSTNGTFVNGVKLRPNVPFPVKRKDVVNFADVCQLDWSQVKDNSRFYLPVILGIVALLLVLVALSQLGKCSSESEPVEDNPRPRPTNVADTTKQVKEEKKDSTQNEFLETARRNARKREEAENARKRQESTKNAAKSPEGKDKKKESPAKKDDNKKNAENEDVNPVLPI